MRLSGGRSSRTSVVSAPARFHDWRERSRSFEADDRLPRQLDDPRRRGDSDDVRGGDSAPPDRFFETTGASAQLGRTFTDRDYAPDAPRVRDTGQRHVAQSLCGRPANYRPNHIYSDGLPHTVIGVMPPGFWLTADRCPPSPVSDTFSALKRKRTAAVGHVGSVIARDCDPAYRSIRRRPRWI